MKEIELKLDLTPEAAATLRKSTPFGGEPRLVRQRAIYFDTPDQALAANGLSLRIRRTGRTRVQTVKAGDDGGTGLFARSEWERRVANDTPVLDDATPIPTVLGCGADNLVALFEIRIERRIWNLSHGTDAIELALDRGEAVAGDRRAPIEEVELELKHGTPAALFATAREIAAQMPVRLGVIGKAERGYRLLAGADGPARAQPVLLDAKMTAAESLRRIAGDCVRHYRLNEMILLARHDSEATHQARVALRRLRTAFAVYRKMLADDRFEPLEREARWLVATIGEARDLYVLLERAAPGPLRERLDRALAAAENRATTALESARARAFPFDLSDWLITGDWTDDPQRADRRERSVKRTATAALNRLRKRVRKRARNLDKLDADSRHRARKTAKKLRYAAEFFAPLFDAPRERHRYERFLAALKRLQDQLGTLNDLATAPAILDALGLRGEPGAAELLTGDAERPHLDAAVRAYRKLIDAKRFWR